MMRGAERSRVKRIRGRQVSSLRMATSSEGVELVWEPPRVAELVPVEAMAYEVEYRFPEVEAAPEDPGLVTDVEDQRDGSWQRTHEHALREAHATLDMPFKEALAAGGVLRVRAFCVRMETRTLSARSVRPGLNRLC